MILKKLFDGRLKFETPVGVVEGEMVNGYVVVDVDEAMAARLVRRPFRFEQAGPDFQHPNFSSEKIKAKPKPKPKAKPKPRAKAKPKVAAKAKK